MLVMRRAGQETGNGISHHVGYCKICITNVVIASPVGLVQNLCQNAFAVFYQLVRLFPGVRDMLKRAVLVAGARQAGLPARSNTLIHVDFCLSSAADSEFSGQQKLVQRGFRQRQ